MRGERRWEAAVSPSAEQASFTGTTSASSRTPQATRDGKNCLSLNVVGYDRKPRKLEKP